MDTNIGYAFVYFDDYKDMVEFKSYFKKYKKNEISAKLKGQNHWKIRIAPTHSDIIWDSFGRKSIMSIF